MVGDAREMLRDTKKVTWVVREIARDIDKMARA
jgi:hypothetical protein